MNNSRIRFYRFFLIISSFVICYLSLFLTIWLWYPEGLSHELLVSHIQVFSIIYPFWMLVMFMHNLFDLKSLRAYSFLVTGLISAMAVNFLLAVTYFYFQPSLFLTPRRFLLAHITSSFILLLLWYVVVKYFLQHKAKEYIYVLSASDNVPNVAETIAEHAYLGFEFVSRLTETTLPELFNQNRSRSVVLAEDVYGNPKLVEQLYALKKNGVVFYSHRAFYEQLFRRVYLATITELWFLENISYQQKPFYNIIKRTVDLVAGLVGFIVFLVTFPFFAILIAGTSKGPVILKNQYRVGLDGQPFRLFKYRTMYGDQKDLWTKQGDSRITPIGKWLRKFRIDEIPQSINFLLGNLSLVGPRPEQIGIVEQLKKDIPFYDERHLVKPGLTGWAQLHIYAGNVDETKLKLQYDLYYIKHRSILFDLEIIFKTAYYVFLGAGR
jgi:exopolysaccharide biosynthesis polyprenyl glycosylphosphotransferase